MPDTITRDEAFRKLAARCSAKECCVAEVREKLHNWNIPRKEEDSIVEQLLKENYIDEARYCRAYAQDQFLRLKRLGQIIVRSLLQTGNAVCRLAHCRQHDDGDITLLPQRRQKLQPAFVRHHNVDNQKIKLIISELEAGFLGIFGG